MTRHSYREITTGNGTASDEAVRIASGHQHNYSFLQSKTFAALCDMESEHFTLQLEELMDEHGRKAVGLALQQVGSVLAEESWWLNVDEPQ